MSRPRTPFGPDQPGRTLGMMLRVLAAESSDGGRLARGRRYHDDDAVVDIVIGRGVVTAEVQGSRPEPYVVTIETEPGTGSPRRRELWVQCTCPDDSGSGSDYCKHAVAAMFALSDEVAIEPELMTRWRSGRRRAGADVADLDARRRDRDDGDDHRDDDSVDDGVDGDESAGGGADVIRFPGSRPDGLDGRTDRSDDLGPPADTPGRPHVDPEIEAIGRLLHAPGGPSVPTLPEVTPIDHRGLADRTIRDVLDDALDHLHLRWE